MNQKNTKRQLQQTTEHVWKETQAEMSGNCSWTLKSSNGMKTSAV
jgi:hypothetical protein